ncbi:MAG: efflux RND transporter permease subunit [Calditrichaceae bacterium]|nr:efflux RND transporter permease subunit [Calditrichaceae bacterium]
MEKITEFSVKFPVTITMLLLGVVLLGVISFVKLGVDLFPELVNPKLYIKIEASELPPEEMERQFIDPLEGLAMRLRKVAGVSSVCRVGLAQITVEYNWDADMDEAFLDLQKNISTYGQNLSDVSIEVTQEDLNAQPILILAFYHPEISDMDELRKTAENYIKNEFNRLEGIAAVEILGDERREVLIETNPYLLEAHNLTLSTVASKIQSYNRSISGGSITEMGRKYIIKGMGSFANLADIENIIVTQKQAAETAGRSGDVIPVYLKDIASVNFKNSEPENIVRLEDKRCLALAIYKESGYNTVKAVEEFEKSLQAINKALPGYQLDIINNQARFINSAIAEVEDSALIGMFLAVIILFVFLKRIGTTAVISIAIPISVVATFCLMYFNGLTLNIMTLGGLALGAGMLVDNAIIVVENIFRRLESGQTPEEAAIKGTAEVSGAITASTITTIIVFLPIVYVHGVAGMLFKEQAWTVAFSLLSSLLVAILVIPMLSSKLIKSTTTVLPDFKSVGFPGYKKVLGNFLYRKNLVMALTVILILISLAVMPFLGSEFLPRASAEHVKIEITLEDGSTLAYTDKVAVEMSNLCRQALDSDFERVFIRTGPDQLSSLESPESAQGENQAVLDIFFTESGIKNFERNIKTIRTTLESFSEAEIRVIEDETTLQSVIGIEEAPLVVDIIGDDLEILYDLGGQAIEKIKAIPELSNIKSSMDRGRPQVDIVIDRKMAGLYELDVVEIGQQLEGYLTGQEAGDWDYSGELQTIRVSLPEPSLSQLAAMEIKAAKSPVRLDEISKILITHSPSEILRNRQRRIVRISAEMEGDLALDKAANTVREQLASLPFPSGYHLEIGGEEQRRQESFGDLKFALILSIILIYMVMASQFESLIHPFTILLTIPLAVVGSILAFFFLNMPLNIMAYIGIIMLAGIAVNDSIILVDAINKLRDAGMERIEAILQAGQNRIRPIIMTSLTTILALLPLTFGFGESAALRAPMAVAVIGGLITSTLLTLMVIPCVYLALDYLRPGKKTD